jgi:hypothetical protein
MVHKVVMLLAYIFGSSLLGLAYGYLVGKMAGRGSWSVSKIHKMAGPGPLALGLLAESVLLFTEADRKSGPAWLMQPLFCLLIASAIAERVAAKVARRPIHDREFEQAHLSIR